MNTTINELLFKLESFWKQFNVKYIFPWDMEMGAATFHPVCFFSVLGNDKKNYMYLQPSRRQADGKSGLSPNRVVRHNQFQVLINDFQENIQEIYLDCLKYIGFDLDKYDIRFIENNWESTGIGAFGVGWEVWINGMEVTQFTFFNKLADIELENTTIELAYGIERMALMLNNKESFFHLEWDKDLSYNELYKKYEEHQTKYYLEIHNNSIYNLEKIEENFYKAIDNNLYYSGYELLLQYNKEVNINLARRYINNIERKNYMNKMRTMTNECGKCFLNFNKK